MRPSSKFHSDFIQAMILVTFDAYYAVRGERLVQVRSGTFSHEFLSFNTLVLDLNSIAKTRSHSMDYRSIKLRDTLYYLFSYGNHYFFMEQQLLLHRLYRIVTIFLEGL